MFVFRSPSAPSRSLPFRAPTFPAGGGNAAGGGATQGPPGARGPAGPPGDNYAADCIRDHNAQADGVTDDTAAINAALAAGRDRVLLPPGTYYVAGAVASAVAGQCITFAPGATLKINPDSGSVVLSGSQQRIEGLSYAITSASSATVTAVTVSGAGSVVDGVRISVSADVPNCTLLKLAADEIDVCGAVRVTTASVFRFGVSVEGAGSTYVNAVTIRGLFAAMGSPSADKTYGALLNIKAKNCAVYDLTIRNTGGHTLFPDGVVIVDGTRNNFYNPQIVLVTGATYAFYMKPAAEFTQVFSGLVQGRNNGTFVTGSEGFYCSHTAGHLKLYGTAVTGWESGVGLHGSCDTPGFYGAVIANNGSNGIKIDANIAGSDWPVSGMSCVGCYQESQIAGGDQVFIRVVSGSLIGCQINSCEVSYDSRMIKVDSGCTGTVDVSLGGGNRIIDSTGGQAAIEPGGSGSQFFYWGPNSTQNVTVYSTDLTKLYFYNDPKLTAVKVGATGTRKILELKYANTANFADVLTAGTSFELTYTVTGAVTTDNLQWNVGPGLGTHAELDFHAYISAANTVKLRARNHSASDLTGVTGNFFCTVTRFS